MMTAAEITTAIKADPVVEASFKAVQPKDRNLTQVQLAGVIVALLGTLLSELHVGEEEDALTSILDLALDLGAYQRAHREAVQ